MTLTTSSKVITNLTFENRQPEVHPPTQSGPTSYSQFVEFCRRKHTENFRRYTHLLMFVDADNLKQVNDSFGHSAGDEFIETIHRILSQTCPEDAVIYRAGGDEFIAYCGISDFERAQTLAADVVKKLNQVQDFGSRKLMMSCSVGASYSTGPIVDIPTLKKEADTALLWIKRNGKGRLKFFDYDDCGSIQVEQSLLTDVPSAISEQQLEVFFQPIFSTNDRSVCGAEALVRWNHSDHGKIQAGMIISAASKAGMMRDLGEYVLNKACSFALKWPKNMFLSVNFSASDFQQCDFGEKILSIACANGFPVNRLQLEITEIEYLNVNSIVLNNLRTLQDAGVKIGVDDFGTGHSSMGNIDRFPANFIKIDRTLIENCNNRLSSKVFLRAINRIAEEAGLRLIAEGVETMKELAIIRSIGIEFAQGYYYSEAIPPSDFENLLLERRSIEVLAVPKRPHFGQ